MDTGSTKRFIKLTTPTGQPRWVDPAFITDLGSTEEWSGPERKTYLYLATSSGPGDTSDGALCFRETPEEILKLIGATVLAAPVPTATVAATVPTEEEGQ